MATRPRHDDEDEKAHERAHVTCCREEKSGPSFSRGRGMASWWGTGRKKFFSFSWKSSRGLWTATMKRSISIDSAQNEYIRARRAKTSSTELRRREKGRCDAENTHGQVGRTRIDSVRSVQFAQTSAAEGLREL